MQLCSTCRCLAPVVPTHNLRGQSPVLLLEKALRHDSSRAPSKNQHRVQDETPRCARGSGAGTNSARSAHHAAPLHVSDNSCCELAGSHLGCVGELTLEIVCDELLLNGLLHRVL